MKTLIIVSKCLRVTKFSSHENWYEFHFKGVCSGEIVKKVVLKGAVDSKLKKGEEYLLYVQQVAIESNQLRGRIVKFKLLEECWDRS